MSDFDEDHAVLDKIEAEVVANPDDYETWEKLVRGAEGLEGGLTRNSEPRSITRARDVYNRFLAKFPLFFGYWKKYADLEFAIAGTEAAETFEIYERGVASIGISVDLWANYCSFKTETNHDQDVIRELFERGANSVGLDFLAHPFWDKYIEFEERFDAHDRVFAILARVINIPMHQYARYFEKYRTLAAMRPTVELAPEDAMLRFRAEVQSDPAMVGRSDIEYDRALRVRVDQYHLEIFNHTQAETTKRWTYESEIKRPYFHVTDLDDAQLENWHRYLDFEEAEGDYIRIAFLYERCLVACALHDDLWQRYARWMYSQDDKEEEVRIIFQRASCIYTPISKPAIRMLWALFEEMAGRPSVAAAIYEAILLVLPQHVDAVVALANLQCRQEGHPAATAVYQHYLQSQDLDADTKGALVAQLAQLDWTAKGSAEEARAVFESQQSAYLGSQSFWSGYLHFEMEQPITKATMSEQYQRIKRVHETIRRNTTIAPGAVKELSQSYMQYLTRRQDKLAAKEFMDLDAEVNGSASVGPLMRAKNMPAAKANGSSNT